MIETKIEPAVQGKIIDPARPPKVCPLTFGYIQGNFTATGCIGLPCMAFDQAPDCIDPAGKKNYCQILKKFL